MGEKTVRCKMRVDEIALTTYGNALRASPVYSGKENSENAKFWAATPGGKFEVSCTKAGVLDHLKPGDEIYIDVTVAPAEA